jgi:hypothetical protein
MVALSTFTRAFATAAVLGAALATGAAAQIQRGETAGVGDPVYIMFVAFANQAQTADVNIQVNAGQTLTQSMLRGGRGEIEFFSSVPSLVALMANNRAMYEPIADAPKPPPIYAPSLASRPASTTPWRLPDPVSKIGTILLA